MASILLANQDSALISAVFDLLNNAGHTVTVAGDGYAVTQQAVRQKIDLLILDYLMPMATGSDILRRLRNCGLCLPVIFVSAPGYRSKFRLEDTPLVRYLEKPVNLEELKFCVDDLLRRVSSPSTERLPPGDGDPHDTQQL